MRISYLFLPLFFTSSLAFSVENSPQDIRKFIYNAGACEHLGGEYDGELPKEEKEKIKKDIDKYCGGAKNQFRTLKEKYKNNPTLLKRINNNYNDSVDSYKKSP
ncbi:MULTISPECIES: hypothetical protein [unclassified Janthinobacterium]|uniref:hypothetical protein n=1 Tax=unclassified Janthinobacterium TaxID=2610881 RepID=UPI00161927F8|nr:MULTISPECIES: hypothetical protein [unclassified Janthinobacterium]MBB5609075.1 hypothetical protein [Janthinobacterium sp. S3T4]MBB5614194.1 hypothetical protein [Janthinobacterium sp. S3M3]